MSPSFWQIIIVLGIVLILFGPNRIPNIGKSLGEAIRGFKKGLSDDEIDVTNSSANHQQQVTNQNSGQQQFAQNNQQQFPNGQQQTEPQSFSSQNQTSNQHNPSKS